LENLRIIRGVVSAAGTILAGQGFSVSHPGTGFYTVMFTSFTGFPTIVATVQSGLARKITSTNVGNGLAEIRVWDDAAANVDAQFHFIAVGPR
jgi:hypothetical protein